jgi:hypothetical protein
MTALKSGMILFLTLSIMIACSKDPATSDLSSKPTLVLAKTVVRIGEPLMVTTKGQVAGAAVHWSASPNASIWTSASGDSATFLFTTPGNYQVGATYLLGINAYAYDSTNISLTVSDSIYTGDSGIAHCDAIINAPITSGDQVILTPIAFSDSAGLVFLVHTQNNYNYAPVLAFTGNFTGQGGAYEADFNTVTEYPCIGYNLQAPATTDVFFSSVVNGTYGLAFKLNGTTYQGSMTLTDASCTFTWNYSSGVTISPLQISKR